MRVEKVAAKGEKAKVACVVGDQVSGLEDDDYFKKAMPQTDGKRKAKETLERICLLFCGLNETRLTFEKQKLQ